MAALRYWAGYLERISATFGKFSEEKMKSLTSRSVFLCFFAYGRGEKVSGKVCYGVLLLEKSCH